MSAFPPYDRHPKPPPHHPVVYTFTGGSHTFRCTCGYQTDPRSTDEEREVELRAHVKMEERRG